jgi:diguanylate cyclase (GGDEF)-like protein
MGLNDSRYEQLKKSIIMLVDDEPVMLEIVQALLEEEGYRRFIKVNDSTRALDKLVAHNPDILLLDLDMPQVNGFQILESLRQHDDFVHLPVIILTASENPDNKLKALELGATDFLSKPVDPSELALRVRNTLTAKAYQDHLTNYDRLTGLPNRKLFLDQLNRGISQAKRDDRSLVLLEIGLDQFSNINETLGVQHGDQILQTVANRLTRVLRSGDIVGCDSDSIQLENTARTGGDEFTVVLYGTNSVENASSVSSRVLAEIKRPLQVDDNDVHLTASIGIAVAPVDGDDADTLFRHAVSAREFTKSQGRDRYQFYSSEMEARSRTIMKMTSDLRTALDDNQFELYYQPQVDSASGHILGMESLIRA